MHWGQPSGPTTFITLTALLPDASEEIPSRAPRLWQLAKIAAKLKCVIRVKSDLKPRKSGTKKNMTPKGENNPIWRHSASVHELSFAVGICCRKNGRRSLFKISLTRHWTFSRHVDNFTHQYYEQTVVRNTNLADGIVVTRPYSTARRQSTTITIIYYKKIPS